MLGFNQYRNLSETDVTPPEEVAPTVGIADKINKLVDGWVADLKKSLFSPTPTGSQRGLWDRFKGSMANLWHGRYNDKNPYYWQNKLGDDLGATESYDINAFTLQEYKILREMFDDLERAINEDLPSGFENLRLNRLIDQKAMQLKNQLNAMLATSVPASPEPMKKAPKKAAEEEEPVAKKPDPAHDHLLLMLKNLVAADAITQKVADDMEDLLNSDNPEGRKRAADQIHNMVASNMKKPDFLSDDHPGDDVSAETHKIRPDVPPTTGKAWTELNDAEQRAWDVYGGGLEDTPGKIDGCLNLYGVKKLPWLLRIGDPRRKLLADQEQGKLRQQDGSCAKAHSHWFRIFTSQNRLEEKGETLKTWADVMARVAEIKKKYMVQRAYMNKHKQPYPIDPDAPEPTPLSQLEPPGPPTKEPIIKPEPKPEPRTADMEIPATTHTPDNALGEPMHRTAPMDDVRPVPPEESAEAPPKEKDRLTMKQDLKRRIMNLSDEETKEQYAKHLKKAKSVEALEELEKEIEAFERLQNDVMDFSWTLNDLKDYYKNKLRA